MKAYLWKSCAQKDSRSRRARDEKGEAAHLFGISLSSVKRVTLGWSLPASTQGKHNRRQEMRVVVLLYRAQLPPFSVKTRPWHIRVNRLAKPLEDLQLLLLTEHQFASGRTLKLEDKLRLG